MKLIMDDGREIVLSEEAQEILKKEISQSKKVNNFSKEGDIRHWYIDSYGEAHHGGFIGKNEEKTFNTYTNKEFAEKIAFKQFMERKLLKFKEEYDNMKLDWNDEQVKWYIYYNINEKNLKLCQELNVKLQGVVHFSTPEIAQKCIEMYGDDLIKYFQLDIW